MTIKNKNIGDKNRKISGKKIMLVTALLSGGVVIRVNNHINHSFGNPSREVINFDLTLESTDVLIDDSGTFYVGQGTPIDNFDISDFVTILDEDGNVMPKSEVTLEWDVKQYFEGNTFGTKGEYLITITATTADGRTGELEYKLVVKEGHVFEEITPIKDIEVDVTNTKEILDFQEYFRVLNSTTGADTGAEIKSTLEDEDLQSIGTTQVIFYTELDGTKFTNSAHISVVDTVAPTIDPASSFVKDGIEWNKDERTITISELDKTLGDFSLDQYATAYDASGDYELSWNFDEVMDGKLGLIDTNQVTITAIDGAGNESTVKIDINVSTVRFEFKNGITEIAFELFHDANINNPIYGVNEFYNVFGAGNNPIADHRISWDLTEEMIRELGEYRVTIEVLDDNDDLMGVKTVSVKVQDTLAPIATVNNGISTSFDIEVNQNISVDNIFMYLDGVSGIDELISVTENSGVWGYRFMYGTQELTDETLKTIGSKTISLQFFDYDMEGVENNYSNLTDGNGNEVTLTFNILDTTKPTVNVVNEIINLEVMQSATKEMIEISNYAEIKDNSGTFIWELRVKGSQDEFMDYEQVLGRITDPSGLDIELVVTDESGNKIYNDMLLIITDTEAPVLDVRTSDETININPSASEINGYRDVNSYVTVSDNSGRYVLEWDFDTVVNVNVAGIYQVTVKAEDEAGNITEATVVFTVKDTELPVIIVNTKTIEIEANEYENKEELEFDINLKDYITVTDNSNGLIDTIFDYSNVDFGAIGNYDVIITATDAAGNESTNVIQLKVIAGEPKVRVVNDKEIIDNVHIDSSNTISGIKIEIKDGKIVIERSSNPTDQADILTHLTMNNLLEFLTIDGETIESQSWDLSTIDFSTIGTYNIQLIVTNNFGKTATETIEFVVIQEYDSILELKGDNFIDLEIDVSNTNRDVAWFESTYDENDYAKFIASGGSGTFVWDQATLTNIDFDRVGSYVVTIYLDDGHADRKELTLSLNIIDTTGPVFTTVNDMETAEVNDKDSNDYAFTDFVTVEDNSGIAPTLSWNLDTQVDFTKVGTYVVTIKAVDAFGNETTKDITFEINDTEAPVLVLNPGMDIQTIEINSRDASSFNINSFVSVTDNSGVAPELEWNIDSVDFGTTGTYTIIIKATDSAKNESNEVTVTFEVEDTIAPSIDIDPSGLEELKVEIDTKSESDYSDWLEDYVTVTDNSNEDITPRWDITSVDFGVVGSYMIVISAVDSSGHTTTTNVVFAVADTTAPTISLISGQETTEYEVFDSKLEDFKITDFVTCDDATDCTMSWDMSSVNFDRVGTYIVTIKAVDMYGNESVQEITIEVQDTTKPEIVITRTDILIAMDKYKSSDFDVNDFAKVTDNYDKSVVLTWNIESVEFNVADTYPVTISAIDSNGNEAIEQIVEFKVEEFNITVNEVIPFVIEVDQGNLESNFDVNTYFTAEDQNGVSVNNIVWNLTDGMLKTYGTYGVMLTITFDTDKVIEMEVTLEVTDTTDPNVTVDTTTTTIELGDTAEFDRLNLEDFVTVTDNSNDVTYSWDFDNVVEQTVAGTYTVSITVTDVAGNETIVTTEIVVEDTVAPDLVLNEDFDRNNIIWSKSTAELTVLAGDKTLQEIDLWELVTATDLSTAGLTIDWSLTEANLDTVGHYTLDIEVSDGTLTSTETITVNVLRATPILNDFNVDKSHSDVTVNVDVTNLNEAITSLVITLQELDGTVVDTYTQTLSALDAYTINNVFNTGVTSNTEYKVVLEYKYSLQEDKTTQVETVTDTKDVKTLAYSQNDVLATITDTYIRHTETIVNYEINNDLSLMTSATLVLTDSQGVETIHTIDINNQTGTHTFSNLKSGTDYELKIKISYDFNDGKNVQLKETNSKSITTLAYTEHDVITDITGITQSPSTISVDYNITDSYGLIVGNGMFAKIYKADNMTTPVIRTALTSLNDTVQFDNLLANTSYIVVIETALDLIQDGVNTNYEIKETGLQTMTESYSFDEIIVNVSNVIVDYNNITFDYEVFDPNGLLVEELNGDKIQVVINNQSFYLSSLSGNVSLEDHLNEVTSDTIYDVQIHFEYNLKDGNGDQIHNTNLYGFVESTRAYDLSNDLTLTSHNLASDTNAIYVDYSLRNLNNIGDMSTMAIVISDANNTEEILLSDYFTSLGYVPLEGQIMLTSINGTDLAVNTAYQISIEIEYDLNDEYTGTQREVLLLETTEIKTQDQELTGYNIISDVTRGYTFLNTSFDIENSLGHADLNTFQIALLDENNNIVPGYDYVSHSVSTGQNAYKFENLTSDSSYTIVYRVENPSYVDGSNGHEQYIDILRNVSTRTYDTSLMDVDYNISAGLTYLYLQDIKMENNNEDAEEVDYSNIIAIISYISRNGQVVTEEKNLGLATEVIFTGIESSKEVNIEFRVDYDLRDGEGVQSGSDAIVRTSDSKTLEYDFTFVVENDEVLITGLTPGFTGDHLVIFQEVEGYPVTNIKSDAFYGNSVNFLEITIPRTLETIGQNAFRNVGLTTVNLTNEYETIPSITPIEINDSITQGILIIEDNAFRDNSITSFDFATTESIGASAFRNNNFDSNGVTLGNAVNYIGDEAFVNANVTKLSTGILISNDTLGSNTFTANSINDLTVGNVNLNYDSFGEDVTVFNNAGYSLEISDFAEGDIAVNGWTYDGNNIHSGVRVNSVRVGNNISRIGAYAFQGNNLTTVDIGDSVTYIGGAAFQSTGISTLSIGESLLSIEYQAFFGNQINKLELPDTLEYIGRAAFGENGIETLVLGSELTPENLGADVFRHNNIKDLTLGNGEFKHYSLGANMLNVFDNNGFDLTFSDSAVGKIETNAWTYDGGTKFANVMVRNVVIGDGITEIGAWSFRGNQLSNVEIGDGVTHILAGSFESTGISTLALGASVTNIEYQVFYNNNMEHVKLPDGLVSIGRAAFAENGMKTLEIGSDLTPENLDADVFRTNSIDTLILNNTSFGYNDLGAPSSVFNAQGFDLTINGSATETIFENAWRYDGGVNYSNIQINNLTLLGDITAIGNNSFEGNKLTEVTIPSNVELIGDSSFKGNQIALLKYDGDKVTTIGDSAFEDNMLVSLTLTSKMASLGSSAFKNNLINDLKIEGDLTEFSDSVFENNMLTSLVLDPNVTTIGAYAFKGNLISELVIHGNIQNIGTEAFANNSSLNTGLKKLTVADGVSASIFSAGNVFIGNQIDSLTLGNTDFRHNTFGNSSNVFASSGFDLTFTANTTGNISLNSWRYDTSGNYSNVQINNLLLGDVTSIGNNAFEGNNLTEVSIPSNLEVIGNSAFKNNKISVLNFTGDEVTTIGESAFENNQIVDLTITSKVATLGKSAFKNNEINNLKINANITEFSESLFENNKLTSLVLDSNITTIGSYAFKGNLISELFIHEDIQSVGTEAFANNSSTDPNLGMKKLEIADGIPASIFSTKNVFIGNKIETLIIGSTDFKHNTFGESSDVFNTTTGLDLTFSNNATGTIVDNAWEYTTDSNTSNVQLSGISIGDSIISIGNKSFYGNKLKTVVIGNGVTSLGEQSFASMGITSLTLGNSVETIGKEAFLDNEITGFMVNGVLSSTVPDTVETIGEGAFKGNSIENLVLPDSVSSVANNAFQDNGMLSLEIGELLSDSNFGTDTFIGNNINDLTIGNIGFMYSSLGDPDKVFDEVNGYSLEFLDSAAGVIGQHAWSYDGGVNHSNVMVKNVIIGDGITEIGAWAFLGNLLSNVEIGDGVTHIRAAAFKNTGISTLAVGVSVTNMEFEVFFGNNMEHVKLPDGLVSIGRAAFAENGMKTLEIGSDLTPENLDAEVFRTNEIDTLILNNTAFQYDSLGNPASVFKSTGFDLTINGSATESVTDNAWRYDGGTSYSNIQINNLTILGDLPSIGSNSFEGNNLTQLTISENMEVIGESAFKDNKIATLNFAGDKVTTIGDSAFENNSLTNLSLASKVETIGSSAFMDNDIAALTLGDSLDKIGSAAFKGNELTSLDMFDNVSEISAEAFMNNKIATLRLSTSLTTIGNSAFEGNKLIDATIPDSVSTVGSYAFKNNLIETFKLSSLIKEFSVGMFDTNKLTSLTIADDITGIKDYAFANNEIHTLVTSKNTSSDILGVDTFSGNVISNLTIGNVYVEHDSFGESGEVFDNNGYGLTVAKTASGIMNNYSWCYGTAYSSVQMTSVVFEDIEGGVLEIRGSSFSFNDLGVVNIANNITAIGGSSFRDAGVTELTLGDDVVVFYNQAFLSNDISSLVIPASVTQIDRASFSSNPNLQEVTFLGGNVINNGSANDAFDSGVIFKNASGSIIT